MRFKSLILAVFLAGIVASSAFASKPGGPDSNGNGHGNGNANPNNPHNVVVIDTSISTGTTTTAVTHGKSTSVHGNDTSAGHTAFKVYVCKATGSVSHPYVLVHVGPKAAARMLADPRNVEPSGDPLTCPTAWPDAVTTTTSTTTTSTTTTP